MRLDYYDELFVMDYDEFNENDNFMEVTSRAARMD